MAQKKIDVFLRKTKKNASTIAFLQQLKSCDEEPVTTNSCNHESLISELRNSLAKEREESENTRILLKNQVETLTQKYNKLKIAHMNLLQTLFEKEKQIQMQDSKIGKLNHSMLNCTIQSQSKEEKEIKHEAENGQEVSTKCCEKSRVLNHLRRL